MGKPLEEYSVDDYLRSFRGVVAARGTYTVEGNVFTRKHVANIDPNLIGSETVAQFSLEGNTMTLRGSTPAVPKFEAKFQRLKPLGTTTK